MKMTKPISGHVVVFGAGRMGADIGIAFARAGWRCDVIEPGEASRGHAREYWSAELARLRARGSARRLRCHARAQDVDWKAVDLVIEAVPEDMALKHAVLRAVDALAPATAVIATNTSSLRITDVTQVLRDPQRGIGMHFGVPAHILPAVEVTRGAATSEATLQAATAWLEALGKVPVVIQRDVAGQIINRLQHAMYREIYHLIDEGIATPRDIDRAVRFGFGLKYSVIGPVVSRDVHGLPVHLAVAAQIYPTLHNGTAPSRTLARLVEQGREGVRTGSGFYEWDPDTLAQRLLEFGALLEAQVKRIRRLGEPLDF